MIKFNFQNKEYSFGGFNVEASIDDGMISINGDKNDFQFAIEILGTQPKTYTKNNKGVSIVFIFPEGDPEFSAYYEDEEDSSVKIELTRCDSVVEGTFEAVLTSEDSSAEIKNGSFSISVNS